AATLVWNQGSRVAAFLLQRNGSEGVRCVPERARRVEVQIPGPERLVRRHAEVPEPQVAKAEVPEAQVSEPEVAESEVPEPEVAESEVPEPQIPEAGVERE